MYVQSVHCSIIIQEETQYGVSRTHLSKINDIAGKLWKADKFFFLFYDQIFKYYVSFLYAPVGWNFLHRDIFKSIKREIVFFVVGHSDGIVGKKSNLIFFSLPKG